MIFYTLYLPQVMKVFDANNQIEEENGSVLATNLTNNIGSHVIDNSTELQVLKQELETTKKKLKEAIEQCNKK